MDPAVRRLFFALPRVVHLSDIHLQLDWRRRSLLSSGWRGAPGRLELHGFGRLRRFAGVSDKIRRLVDQVLRAEADHVLLTGDLTAMGDERELHEARLMLEPLIRTKKLALIPGNHDRYTDAPHARRFERIFAQELSSDMPEHADAHGWPYVRLVSQDLAIVGLDSTRVRGWSQYVIGRLGRAQLQALKRVLDDERLNKRTVLVLSHHGPFGPHRKFTWSESGLLDARAFIETVRERNVIVHHGHSHRRYWHRAHGSAPHVFGGGSATDRGTEGFWQLELDDHRRVDARMLKPGH
jgi:3',5'-cyclic AMP phosphodiesterase CpdA